MIFWCHVTSNILCSYFDVQDVSSTLNLLVTLKYEHFKGQIKYQSWGAPALLYERYNATIRLFGINIVLLDISVEMIVTNIDVSLHFDSAIHSVI